MRNQLRVVVRDNGCGIDPEIVQSKRVSHWGLVGIRERAKGIGAEVEYIAGEGLVPPLKFLSPGVLTHDRTKNGGQVTLR